MQQLSPYRPEINMLKSVNTMVGEFIEFVLKQLKKPQKNVHTAKALRIHSVATPAIRDLQPVCPQPTATI
jgi:hypothetical protein